MQETPLSPRSILSDVIHRLGGRIARGAIGVIAQNILNLAAMLFVSRTLGAEDYGRLGFALFFSVQAFQLLQWGMQPLVTRDLVREPAMAAQILGACLKQRTATALLATVAGAVLAFVADWEGGALLIWLGVVDGVLLGFTLPSAFDARLRLATHAAVTHVRPAGFLLGTLLLHAVSPESFGARSVLLVHAAAIALSVIVEWAIITRMHGRPSRPSAGRAWTIWRDSAPVALGDLAGSLLAYAGIPVVAMLGHAEETGHLNLSNQLAVSLGSLAVAPAQGLHAHLSALADPWSPSATRQVLVLSAALAAAAVVVSAGVAVAAPWVVPLVFGEAFAPSGLLLQVDAFRLVGILGGAALMSGLFCRGRPGVVAACQAAGLLVTVTLALSAVPAHGAMAAAVASTTGRLVAAGALLVAFLSVVRRVP